jgi:hypothetical protein
MRDCCGAGVKRWELARLIQASNISDRAKVVGLVIASHWSPKYDRARLRLETLMKESGGKSRITVIRAVNDLIEAQIFTRVRTGRSSILKLGERAEILKAQTDSGSITWDTSEWERKPPKPRTGTRFKEFCPVDISTEDSGERYTKDQEFYLGF